MRYPYSYANEHCERILFSFSIPLLIPSASFFGSLFSAEAKATSDRHEYLSSISVRRVRIAFLKTGFVEFISFLMNMHG